MSARTQLPNRVDPFGALVATPERGLFLGIRGGRFHRSDRTLSARRWASRRWLVCLCEFKGRKREVWGPGYTQLFFLDEVTAFAAGHRPCFECRRACAEAFRDALGFGRLGVDEIDARLHGERLHGRDKKVSAQDAAALPDGAMVVVGGRPHAVIGDRIAPWSFDGYGELRPRPRSGVLATLTPPTILRALAAGYAPVWARRSSPRAATADRKS